MDNNIDKLEERLLKYNESSDADLIHMKFKPSKTAQNSLNFISSTDEALLKDLEINDDIYDMVRIIYLLLGIKIESRDKCLYRLYEEVIPSYGVNNISNIF